MSGQQHEPTRVLNWTSKTSTVWSPDYSKAQTYFREIYWHDVYPYCLSLWPGIFHEAVFHGWWWIRRVKDICITVEIVTSGEVVYECGGRVMTLRPGMVYLQLPGHDVLCRNGTNRKTQHFQLTLFGGITSFYSIWFGIPEPTVISFPSQSGANPILGTMKRIGALLQQRDPATAADIYTLCHQMLARLADAYHRSSNKRFYPEIVFNAIFRIESNLERGITINEIAKDMGVSEMTLLRNFHKYLSMSPSQYMIKVRMEKGIKMLAKPEFSIKEIASQLGYKNQLYFSSAFRKYHGISPSACRKELGV